LTLRLSEAAAALGIPDRSLQRALHAVGSGFRQELERLRVAQIAELLAATSDKVETIAVRFGVTTPSLSRMFTRVMGETPAQFRARRKGER
jgi:AraC-like DNA-binding protein